MMLMRMIRRMTPHLSSLQLCGDRHGGPGSATDGLPLSEHQTLCGELPAHGGKAAGVQRTGPAGSGNQLGESQNLLENILRSPADWSYTTWLQ